MGGDLYTAANSSATHTATVPIYQSAVVVMAGGAQQCGPGHFWGLPGRGLFQGPAAAGGQVH